MFKKGETGNPGGRPKDKPFTDALRIAINRVREGDPKGRKNLAVLADKLIECALAGEGWAFQQIADRLDGKPMQATEVSGPNGGPIETTHTDADRIRALAGLLARAGEVNRETVN